MNHYALYSNHTQNVISSRNKYSPSLGPASFAVPFFCSLSQGTGGTKKERNDKEQKNEGLQRRLARGSQYWPIYGIIVS